MPVRIPFIGNFLSRRDRRAAASAVRRFDGAAGGRRGWGMGVFNAINPEVAAAGPKVRQRARYLAANNPWIGNGVHSWTTALVGAGIMPTPKHPAADVRAALQASFLSWAETAEADGRTDLFGLIADIARALVIDGESFAQVIETDEGPRLRLLPAEHVDKSMTRELGGGAFIVQGVEFASDGRRVAYHVFPSRPTDQFASYAAPIRVPAEDILHVFKPLAPGQVRGVSWLALVILSAHEFDQLCDALLMGAKISAMHAGFLIDQYGTAGEAYDGTEAGGIMDSGLEPGTLKRLPSGLDIKFNTPAQAQEMAAFLRLNLQGLAAGLGLPEHLLSGDLTNANYSSLRAGLLPFRQRVEQVQYHTLAPQLLRPVWRRAITFAVLSEAVAVEDLTAAFAVEWIMPRPLQVDPQKDVAALREMLELRLMSRRQAVAEQGWDVESLDAKIAADAAREAALGLLPEPKKESAS